MAINTYANLQTTIKNWLNRSDLDTVGIPEFIELAERRIRRDHRARKLLERTFAVSIENVSLPTDFASLEELYHDASGTRGEIEIVPAGKLSVLKALYGSKGRPSYGAILDSKIRFAPVPDQNYNLLMTYWRKILTLSTSQVDNWLLLEHSDIYLYASLVESAPFLKNDSRLSVWEQEYQKRMEELHVDSQRHQWSGNMTRRPRRSL